MQKLISNKHASIGPDDHVKIHANNLKSHFIIPKMLESLCMDKSFSRIHAAILIYGLGRLAFLTHILLVFVLAKLILVPSVTVAL